jgi:hypothetical protein
MGSPKPGLLRGKAVHEPGEVIAREVPLERLAASFQRHSKALRVRATSVVDSNSFGSSTLRWMIEK